MHDRLPTHSPSADSDDTLILPGRSDPADTQLDDSDANNTPSAVKNLEMEFVKTSDKGSVKPSASPTSTTVDGIPKTNPASVKALVKSEKDVDEENGKTSSSPSTSTPGDDKTKPASVKASVHSEKEVGNLNGKTSSPSTSTPGDGIPKTKPASVTVVDKENGKTFPSPSTSTPGDGILKTKPASVKALVNSEKDVDKVNGKTSSPSTSTPGDGIPALSVDMDKEIGKTSSPSASTPGASSAPTGSKGKQPKLRARVKQPGQKAKRTKQSDEEKKRKHRLACDRWHEKWISKGVPRTQPLAKANMAPSDDPSPKAKAFAKKASKTKTNTKKKEIAKKRDLRSVKGEFIRAFLEKYESTEPETRQSRLAKASKAWMESDERAKLKAKPGSQIL